jgi:hypothetical protein
MFAIPVTGLHLSQMNPVHALLHVMFYNTTGYVT